MFKNILLLLGCVLKNCSLKCAWNNTQLFVVQQKVSLKSNHEVGGNLLFSKISFSEYHITISTYTTRIMTNSFQIVNDTFERKMIWWKRSTSGIQALLIRECKHF